MGTTFQVGSVSFKMIPIPGKPFAMMETPVTQELYDEVIQPIFMDGLLPGPQNPVGNVSWYDAVKFCDALTFQTGSLFRLPTSEEWEFSALGGLSSFEDFVPIEDYAVFNTTSTAPVCSKLPNGYGLYDMLGNVYEWTSTESTTKNLYRRAIRGGSWFSSCANTLLNNRQGEGMSNFTDDLGFRCVMDSIVLV